MPTRPRSWQEDIEGARGDRRRVLVEGMHALKHALRFGGVVERIGSPDPPALHALLADLAPDLLLPVPVEHLAGPTWQALTGGGLPSPALAIARRPVDDLAAVLTGPGSAPVVLLEGPTHLGNVGAVVRVAAAAGADGVVVVGEADPWHPRAVRGGAGLQFALPTGRRATRPTGRRPLVALHPDGDPLHASHIAPGSMVAFGTERHGLSDDVLTAADRCLRIPMRAGVSSLNLATSVAAVLYGVPGLHAPDASRDGGSSAGR